ncbi:hypothetical protein SEA_REDRAIDER77_30 [Mycobacterium phage RedRaider77]|uniref:Uncharacterized protein n=1 Tax=Mycobacterium phage RedRaider77 TaxID=2500794 RepID=A0A411AYA8_9CAUD|nr:hypothetical protein SEA_REDRAIDER77_30 [Mycobacterium phage RedRaider77]
MFFEKCECGESLPPRRCPHCGRGTAGSMSIADPEGHSHIQPGDGSICAYCSGISIATKSGLRVCSDEEFMELILNPDMQKAIAAVAALRERGRIE